MSLGPLGGASTWAPFVLEASRPLSYRPGDPPAILYQVPMRWIGRAVVLTFLD
jgi:hypothetical protein